MSSVAGAVLVVVLLDPSSDFHSFLKESVLLGDHVAEVLRAIEGNCTTDDLVSVHVEVKLEVSESCVEDHLINLKAIK